MTPYRNWFFGYEEIKGVDFLLGDESPKKIIGRGKFQLILKYEWRGTLPSVLHILGLVRNLISISKMSDASVQIVFDKDTCKMVRGAMVLMRGIRINMLYKLLVRTDESICLRIVDPKTNDISSCSTNLTMLWHR